MITEIYQHNINWWLKDEEGNLLESLSEMSEADIEHIQEMIAEGYNQGQLISNIFDGDDVKEYYGWWKIAK